MLTYISAGGIKSLQTPKILSSEQNIYLKNSDGNLLTYRGCKVASLVFMWLTLVLIFISSMCGKYEGDIYAIFSWL